MLWQIVAAFDILVTNQYNGNGAMKRHRRRSRAVPRGDQQGQRRRTAPRAMDTPTVNFDGAALPSAGVLYTPRQVARKLQVSPRSVFRLVQAGRLPFIRVGRQLRFDPRDVDGAFEKERAPAPVTPTPPGGDPPKS